MQIIRNPVTKKRLKRFRAMKRAYYSFWILLVLYGLSLFSELLCNGVPLYIHFNNGSYFPLVKYYSEDVFLGNGRQTRPDYKELRKNPVFSKHPGNYMIFPPHPYGPLESIRPETIPVANEVTMRYTPVPRVGTVDIRPDFTVAQSSFFSYFVGKTAGSSITGIDLDRYFDFPEPLKEAMQRRFANRAAPYEVFRIPYDGRTVEVALSTYRPRAEPPDTLRLIFREIPATANDSGKIVFKKDQQPVHPGTEFWKAISEDERKVLVSLVAERFSNPVDDYRIVVNGRQYILSFNKADVRFPFPPVDGHPLGIDAAGRDVLARILYGLRIALTFGLLLVGASMILGIAAGSVQGYYGGKFDITAQRLIEIWSALPFLYVMILMGSIYGRSFMLLLIIYGLFNWIGISYYLRAEFLSLRKRPFVEAARCMGVPTYKIIFKHILPNALVPVITFFPFSLVGAIGALAALDYLGFGLPPPTPSWGEMLFEAQQYRWAWWLILYPSVALFTVMLLGVFIGEGIRNAYDPKQYSRLE